MHWKSCDGLAVWPIIPSQADKRGPESWPGVPHADADLTKTIIGYRSLTFDMSRDPEQKNVYDPCRE